MNKILLVLIAFIILSCSSTKLNGIFECSKLAGDETSKNNTDITTLFGDCIYQRLEFKGENTVIIHSLGMTFPTSYIIEEDFLKVKTDKGDLIFGIKDNNTLIGQGFAKGIYSKITK